MSIAPVRPTLAATVRPSARALRVWAACGLLALASLGAGAPASAQGIYTCVDAQGRRLTSDRPILACLDREQRELNSSGSTRRILPPTLTAAEREAREARERDAAIERQRAQNMIRRDQALLTRYPDKATHDAGRKEALAQTQIVVDAAQQRIAELALERKALDDEMEFYRKNPSNAPAKVRRGIEENAESVEAQRRAIAGQQEERNRINARFDIEAERLRALWQAKPAEPAVKR